MLPGVFILAAVGGCTAAADVTAPPPRGLSIDQLVEIRHPSNPVWSPDGRVVAFIWDRAGVSNLFVSDVGGGTPKALTTFTDGTVGAPFWIGTGPAARVYFAREGDLWAAAPDGGAAGRIWTTSTPESDIAPSPDGRRVAFVRAAEGGKGADLWVRTLGSTDERRLAHDDSSILAVSWSPDAAHLGYSAGARSIRHEQTPEYSGAKLIFTITERTPSQAFVVPAAGGKATPIGPPFGGPLRWIDARRVVFDRQSPDYKRRTIFTADIATGAPRLLREDVDEKFWSIPGNTGAAAQPSPDGKWIAFLSDRDGWDHLYVMPSAGGDAVQVTKGKFEAWRPVWSRDGSKIAFDANGEGAPGTRHLGVAEISGTTTPQAKVTMITGGRGTNVSPEWSPDGSRLAYQHTDTRNSADIFVVEARPGATAVRLGDSMPTGVDRSRFVEPELVSYPGPDGQSVPAWLFVPKGLDRTKKHPAIVWIHGDGVNQNYDGWHVQRNYAVYYSFHQYLLEQGYVVIAPDYRGSIGYGKAWRQGVHMDVGGRDAKDAWMAGSYLKTLPYVDGDRMGVWGLSYGGFFTLIAMTDQPSLFRAGVDVAGVVDYAMYYEDPYHGGWTASRIGTPEQNPGVYAQASPFSHVDRLARPLLVLHGTSDVNVPYLHSVRLADELLKKGKGELFDFVTYPGEFHYFTRAHVLKDAWTRVDRFFAKHLRGVTGETN
jgi:dipeptidyl aminopeptidase/acylaminoacyl peptidase